MRSLVLHGVLCVCCACPLASSAQTNGPAAAASSAPLPVMLSPREIDLSHHAIGPRGAVHMAQDIDSNPRQAQLYDLTGSMVELEVIVSEDGHVESATVSKGPPEYVDQARQIELERTFRPWLRDGSPIRVKFSDYVPVLPPERWAAVQVAFPESVNWDTTEIKLERTACFGACPAYKVAVSGDGTIHFSGAGGWGGAAIPGDHLAHISPGAVRDLILDFKRANFLSAKDKYVASISDNPTYTLTLTINGRSKTVEDYVGTRVGMPLVIEDLEDEVDTVADSARWITGNSHTMDSLEAEHWPFASSSTQNLALYTEAIRSGNQPLVEHFIAARAPAVSPEPKQASPVCVASASGALTLVERMMPRDAQGNLLPIAQNIATQCLWQAAASGSVETLQYWLDRGADWKTSPAAANNNLSASMSLLATGIYSGKADMVRRLLDLKLNVNAADAHGGILAYAMARDGVKDMPRIVQMLVDAGADVNALDYNNETPLEAAKYYPTLVPALVAAGASLEAKRRGETALTYGAFREDYVRAMLAAGANPAAVADNGDTPLKMARQYRCLACANLIEEALKQRGMAVPSSLVQ